ncbi:MAG: hypothetical protein ACRCZF_16990, partial [Gemmataceae bacterium]
GENHKAPHYGILHGRLGGPEGKLNILFGRRMRSGDSLARDFPIASFFSSVEEVVIYQPMLRNSAD